jgi:hypothetical protein
MHRIFLATIALAMVGTMVACSGADPSANERDMEDPVFTNGTSGGGTNPTTGDGGTQPPAADSGTTVPSTHSGTPPPQDDSGTTVPPADSGRPPPPPPPPPPDDGGLPTEDCPLALQGSSCDAYDFCSYSASCILRRCSCIQSRWSCTEEVFCEPDSCPETGSMRCGDSCNVEATDCGCRRGGSDFSSCDCIDGRWRC